MTEDIQWKTPAGRQQAGAAHRIAEMLKGRPGNWAIIEEYDVPTAPDGADEETKKEVADAVRKVRAKASSRASLIKQGRVAAFRVPEGETTTVFTAVSRSELDEGKRVLRVYAVCLEGEEAEKYLAEQADKKSAKEAKAAAAADDSGAEAAETVEPVVAGA